MMKLSNQQISQIMQILQKIPDSAILIDMFLFETNPNKKNELFNKLKNIELLKNNTDWLDVLVEVYEQKSSKDKSKGK